MDPQLAQPLAPKKSIRQKIKANRVDKRVVLPIPFFILVVICDLFTQGAITAFVVFTTDTTYQLFIYATIPRAMVWCGCTLYLKWGDWYRVVRLFLAPDGLAMLATASWVTYLQMGITSQSQYALPAVYMYALLLISNNACFRTMVRWMAMTKWHVRALVADRSFGALYYVFISTYLLAHNFGPKPSASELNSNDKQFKEIQTNLTGVYVAFIGVTAAYLMKFIDTLNGVTGTDNFHTDYEDYFGIEKDRPPKTVDPTYIPMAKTAESDGESSDEENPKPFTP